MPLQTYGTTPFIGAVGVRVGAERAHRGRAGSSITAPRAPQDAPVERSLVIGDRLYTLSYLGLSSSSLDNLAHAAATRPFKEGRRGARRRGSSGRRGYEGRGWI